MKYDITHALQSLKPGAQWTLNGDDISGLEWLDSKKHNQQKQKSIVRFLNLI